jgi:hypothetical protein
VPHDQAIGNTVLCMPDRLELALELESASGLTVQLTGLRLVVEARKEARFVTTVSLSLAKLPRARKRAVVRSLETLFRGHHALISLHGVKDMIEEGDKDELTVMMAQLRWCVDFIPKLIVQWRRIDISLAMMREQHQA